jgi:hypothetical protein
VNAPQVVYWASAALMWTVVIFACVIMRHWRRRLKQDVALAVWCRDMQLTVTTHTAEHWSSSLAEIALSQAAGHRAWNLPIHVELWSKTNAPDEPPLWPDLQGIVPPTRSWEREQIESAIRDMTAGGDGNDD